GWGGRYVLVRENTWLDPVPEKGYSYPEGRWYGSNAWGRVSSKKGNTTENSEAHKEYFKPIWRWSEAFQNDFAARADWCVKPFEEANHPPVVKVDKLNVSTKPGSKIQLNAKGTSDPDGDKLNYKWWQYEEADTFAGSLDIENSTQQKVSFTVPSDAKSGETIHIIVEVSDNGLPQLTRYQRVVLTIQ
ncbi:MAG: hypothetical protein R3182_15310, partial [Draconibacterium sp.]|nr:hypothetical protein [Draconibacterium sp.]